MATVRILSWNIQKLNLRKNNDPNFINYMAQVINHQRADIVGIMEVVGDQGQSVRQRLVTQLNNLPAAPVPWTWKGSESKVQPSGPYEQYFFVWKDEANVLTANELEFELTGIVTEDTFHALANTVPPSSIINALETDGYIEDLRNGVYKVRVNQEDNLRNSGYTLQLPSLQVNSAILNDIKRLLANSISVYFNRRNSRPPFTGMFTLGNNTPLPIILFHAPGPGDGNRYQANNNLAHVQRVHGYPTGVIMGDLNITRAQHQRIKRNSAQLIDNRRNPIPKPNGARGNIYKHIFEPLTDNLSNGGLGYTSMLDHTLDVNLSSLKTSIPSTLPNPISTDARIHPYDKFFVKGLATTPNSAKVVATLSDIVADTPVGIKQLAINIYNAWRLPHFQRAHTEYTAALNDAAAKQAQLVAAQHANDNRAIQRLPKLIARAQTKAAEKQRKRDEFGPVPAVNNIHDAFKIYRNAISDHLPIVIELQY